MHSSGFFSDKAYCKVDFKREISGSHMISDQSLLLSTIVLNDILLHVVLSLQSCTDGFYGALGRLLTSKNFLTCKIKSCPQIIFVTVIRISIDS